MTISSHEDLRDDHLFTAAVDALERQARQHTAGMAELGRTIRVLLGASAAGLLKPEDDHYIRGLVAEREPEPVPDEEWQAPDEGEVITARVGVRCVDGNLSTATGSGACSHHGGVAAWLISDCTVDDFADHPDEKWIRENCYLEWEPAA